MALTGAVYGVLSLVLFAQYLANAIVVQKRLTWRKRKSVLENE